MRFVAIAVASLIHSGSSTTETTTPAPKLKGGRPIEDIRISEQRGWFFYENAPVKYIQEVASEEHKSETTPAPLIFGGCFF